MPRVTCRFYGPLNDLLPSEARGRDIVWHRETAAPVREAIEGLGVPHVEVALILVNGEPAGWDRRLEDGDRVSVYPPFASLPVGEGLDSGPSVSVEPGPAGRFVLDVHLGRLARWLRLLGFDAAYANDHDDATLAAISADEGRILLTRDRHLLMRRIVRHGHWMRSTDPQGQLREVIRRYDLLPLLKPYTRCALCNGTLRRVTKAEVIGQLEPDTARYHDAFYRCEGCGHVYWPGSHVERVQVLIDRLREQGGG